MKHKMIALWLGLGAAACGGAAQSTDNTTAEDEIVDQRPPPVDVETGSIEAALAGAQRSDANRARDQYRHPAETLAFFGLEPGMHVIEMSPGGGWYTEVLAPVLRDHGTLTVAVADPEESEYSRTLFAHLDEHPEVYDQVQHVIFGPPEHPSLGEPGSADLVLTFRSTHGWINRDVAAQVYQAMFDVLRPGGVLGVVQHRASEGADVAESSEAGYVPEAAVIALAEAAGFVLEERSEINANPSDTHDHPEGVWTLPPVLRMGDERRDEWLAIGESDRMTLRFRKPAAEGEASEDAGDGETAGAEAGTP